MFFDLKFDVELLALLNFGEAALFFAVWIGLGLPILLPMAIALQWQPGKPIAPAQKIPLLLGLYLLAPAALWAAGQVSPRLSTRSSFGIYGLAWSEPLWQGLGLGLLVAIAGVGLWLGVQVATGWGCWQTNPLSRSASRSLIAVALLGLAVGLVEELVFRGFLPLALGFDLGPLAAVAIANLLFALLHLVWDGRATVPQLPGLLVMGLVLSRACWIARGNLGLAWGLHAGWIMAIASLEILGALEPTGRVPAWITGLDGKPLAGALGLLLMLGTAIALAVIFQNPVTDG
ncbi:CPBP family intramembrane glutamic endopeptidase [Thermoleptolyngbya sp. M55_K2018_002]|uniref:CPBP family intramembrane glutamic endopeptidase n=1 Tax=Thermoleptolyngbya sp. M55_K2018_002 TaxID=2747808 RepID=UPI0019F4685D|nr:CPBP family intramembrane glutamic endopeptidase [Thermoleptolyngbya sp. M55_K2018_002]HIK39250.1 CPBP family intramembrane metalloprotease [Thermoleptolyngbya sp. M55_K2018_002]